MLECDEIVVDVVHSASCHFPSEVVQEFLSNIGEWNFAGAYLFVVRSAISAVDAANVLGLCQTSVESASSFVKATAIEKCDHIDIGYFR